MKTPKTKKEELLFELKGKIFLVERKPGKPDKRTEIDGKLVLECLVAALREGLRRMERRR